MSPVMLPPEPVECITYLEDGSNAIEVRRWLVKEFDAYDVEISPLGVTGYARTVIKYASSFYVSPGQTVARHLDRTLTVHDAAEVATWGVSEKQWGCRDKRGVAHSHRSEDDARQSWEIAHGNAALLSRIRWSFPDGSRFETAWKEEA